MQPVREGHQYIVGSTNNEICPILACLAYITVRGSSPGPFFCLEDGSPLTKVMFVSQVRGILSQAGLDASLYAGHSFRMGASTSAAQAGTEDSVIKAMGHRSSASFLLYVCTPRQQLGRYSCVCVCVCVFICMYVCIMYVCTYVCMYVRTYVVRTYICMYVCF